MNKIEYYDSESKQNRIITELRSVYEYRNLVFQMTLRNITIRYKRSFLGMFWTMLEPLMMMVVMAFVFSSILQRGVENYPIFLFTGLLIWNYFSQATNSAMSDFSNSGRLLSKVYLPQSVFIFVSICTALVNFAISMVALLVVSLFFKAPISVYGLLILLWPLFILTIFNLGIGLFLAPLNVLYSDIGNVYNIFLRLLMYLSAIFYPVETLPGWLRTIIELNPVYQFIYIFRHPIYLGLAIPADSMVYVTVWTVIMLVVGFTVFTEFSEKVATKL